MCRACCLVRARETTVKSMRDHPSERRAASAPTKSRYAHNCTLFPKGNRSPASPAHPRKTTHYIFFPGVVTHVRSKRRFVAKNALRVRLFLKPLSFRCPVRRKTPVTVVALLLASSCTRYIIGSSKLVIASNGSGPSFCPTRIFILATCLLAGIVAQPAADVVPVAILVPRACVR